MVPRPDLVAKQLGVVGCPVTAWEGGPGKDSGPPLASGRPQPGSELRLSCNSLLHRAGYESLARRLNVWLPVPERLQPCVDPALHEASRESPGYHRDGGVQP